MHILGRWSRPSFGRRGSASVLKRCFAFAGLRHFGGLDEPAALASRVARAALVSGEPQQPSHLADTSCGVEAMVLPAPPAAWSQAFSQFAAFFLLGWTL